MREGNVHERMNEILKRSETNQSCAIPVESRAKVRSHFRKFTTLKQTQDVPTNGRRAG